jgi:putative tryptophan/tyrosine transport system substrate-binding protein
VKRRRFITLLGGAAATWPLAARAQQPATPVVGLLGGGTFESDAFRVRAFQQGLSETGYAEGRNVKLEYRWAEGQYDRLPALAADLVSQQVAVIAATFLPAALAAKAATATIPIVFATGADPVKLGLVASFNRPGGNVTGISVLFNIIVKKQIEMLSEMAPTAGLIGFLVNPANPNAGPDTQDAQEAALALGRRMIAVRASSESEIETAFGTLIQQQAGALLVAADVFLTSRTDKIVDLAAGYKLPMLCQRRECTIAGGLMSYGGNLTEGYRWQGVYAGRILKGEKPADLPVQQSVKLDLVINLKTAKSLGLTVPPTLLARADEVIE